ncbi:MAG TPA: shikimate dehydrogenase [Thermodesulfovibrionales bacterium]|nr:shikimate dehydrogenase [Thermodesulfovibrionales bacterium]
MEISGKTEVVGLFGYPVEHSLSPAMHNAAFEHLGLDYRYVTFSVRPDLLNDAVKGIVAMNLRGVNVTVPHKEKVISLLDKVNEEASFLGAVNTILNDKGTLTGFNTDGRGFMESLSEEGITVKGRKILILGAGGACRAVSYYLSESAANLQIFDVDHSKALKLVNDLSAIRPNITLRKQLTDLGETEVLINATPLGLKEADPSPVDIALISGRLTVCDLIYRETPLLKAAARKGCKTLNGLGMLLHQGVLSFEIWTGVKPPVDLMRSAIEDARAR